MPLTKFGDMMFNTDHIVRVTTDAEHYSQYYTVTFIDKSWIYIYERSNPTAYRAFGAWVRNVPSE